MRHLDTTQETPLSMRTSVSHWPPNPTPSHHNTPEGSKPNPDKDLDKSDEGYRDSDEEMSEGSFDLAEDKEHRQNQASIWAKNTTKQHSEHRLDLCARGEAALSQFEQLSLSIQDFHKLLLGIFRKT
ncbi:uncharacterized protein MELLADRAFT_107516 [Melampsora larici-populina 98AG31]|uniref:Uncharacterized protein n=1 Tax=Melampsora larici-populina (strain 98AG31 / pathotype 3-4-7) TaxID=747676 RepID=F4RQI2_MELLP|nr:uncharacterized protein MELLADRAFT_107516 [Melampsora larici-populina 98AG31]EGG05508.1 hypothetical protein MELLADRAFT_107516 [Melampsora larici-populina 98AG31]